jgi:hypothetical protein
MRDKIMKHLKWLVKALEFTLCVSFILFALYTSSVVIVDAVRSMPPIHW